jgi:hypothetical protein
MFDPATRPRRRTPWFTLVFGSLALAAVLAMPGTARADLAPPPAGHGGGSSVAGADGAAGSGGAAGAPPTKSDDGGGCAVSSPPTWSDLAEGPLAAGMIGVGLAAFVWSRRRRSH